MLRATSTLLPAAATRAPAAAHAAATAARPHATAPAARGASTAASATHPGVSAAAAAASWHASNAARQSELPAPSRAANDTPVLDLAATAEATAQSGPAPQIAAAGPEGASPDGEGPTFASEFGAGVRGYVRSVIKGDPPADYEYQDSSRAQWDQDLLNSDIPPTLQRQLRSQNHSQDQAGNHLPPEAGAMMIDRGEKLSEACRSGDRMEAQQRHQDYMLDSIEPFEQGGSSSAPRVLHHLGVLWQGPGIMADPDHLMRQPRSLMERIGLQPPASPPGGPVQGPANKREEE